MYLHASADWNYAAGERIGLTGGALIEFRRALSSVEVQVEVNPDTGETTILAVDGRKLAEKGVAT